jgi:hypothetical protein
MNQSNFHLPQTPNTAIAHAKTKETAQKEKSLQIQPI